MKKINQEMRIEQLIHTEENKSQETENTKIQETKNSNSETFSESEMRREKDSKE